MSWWRSGAVRGSPVAVSHKRAVLSSLPVRAVLPSGLKATAKTSPSWRIDLPRRQHGPAVRTEKGDRDAAVMTERRAARRAGGRIPEAGFVAPAPDEDCLPIGVEPRRINDTFVGERQLT